MLELSGRLGGVNRARGKTAVAELKERGPWETLSLTGPPRRRRPKASGEAKLRGVRGKGATQERPQAGLRPTGPAPGGGLLTSCLSGAVASPWRRWQRRRRQDERTWQNNPRQLRQPRLRRKTIADNSDSSVSVDLVTTSGSLGPPPRPAPPRKLALGMPGTVVPSARARGGGRGALGCWGFWASPRQSHLTPKAHLPGCLSLDRCLSAPQGLDPP